MQIKLIPVAAVCDPKALLGTTAVVFDVLRATSTIVTALAAGYRRVYPVAQASAAVALARRHGFVLSGERGGEKIEGFPHGNSPLEFAGGPGTGSSVLVITTSNGTGAIRRAASASPVLIGSLLNARAVARAALEQGQDISLVCAGTGGLFSLEDILGAGFVLLEILQQLNPGGGEGKSPEGPAMDDLAITACGLARLYHNDPLAGLYAGQHGQRLLKLGREEDLRWCAGLNRFDIAPVFTGEYITLVPDNNG
ncbi:2-phosphosulfolactate phosphatase [Desulfallas thermosapovorans]|uniref:Probable 2-phosphosulfolactate phosphatase n=1 Tax=Desulfallas thermosapovorans DSM 6562 TaxID=1121431 RepID=A0A5S4ZTW7_9FIRM|nr:2-phosphosulfolactate phosphatase [Desulfallas thermosapovorans]TYO95540.1 2-phosphosulfolactate phosphatase [Desulfallas thermosapovorans DSM 6562]